MNKKVKILILIILLLNVLFTIPYSMSKYVLELNFPLKIVQDLDLLPPSINIIDINNTTIGNNETATEKITISYEDDMSGIDTIVYRYNPTKKEFTNLKTYGLTNNSTFTDKGWYEIVATDKAGNQTIKYIFVDWAVCRIEQVYYRKLEWAINDVPTTNSKTTIVMLRNVSEINTISTKKNASLDINNTTITGSFTIAQNATMEVKNGTVKNSSSVPTFTNNGTLIVTNGTYSSTNNSIISNIGTLNINGGNLTTSNNTTPIQSTGSTSINGGTIKCTSSGNALNIAGGTTSISSGIIENTNTGKTINISNGTLNVTGGNIKNSGTSNIINATGGTLNLSGGTYNGNASATYINIGPNSTLNLKGSNISSTNSIAINTAGTTIMTSGTITTTTSNALNSTGSTSINGGTIKCTSSGNALNIAGGTTSINNGTIQNTSSGKSINILGGTTTINNGTISNTGNGNIIALYGGTANLISGTYTGNTANSYLYNENGILNLKGANITALSSNIVFTYSQVNIYSGNLITTQKKSPVAAFGNNAIVNVTGGTIKCTATSGTLDEAESTIFIYEATAFLSGGQILGSSVQHAIHNEGGTLNISGSTLSSAYRVVHSTGFVNMSSGSVIATNGNNNSSIYVFDGILNITGGTVKNNHTGINSYAIYKRQGSVSVSNATIIGNVQY